ncbi:MAG: NAD(P)-binding domain-containing protein [Chitinophagaceae bacterium]|nr:NAD(P)-binding domain-containing protein [Chitinophagaceae bacterium]
MKFGLLGSGSWGTALAKLLTDNKHAINWWLRSDENIVSFKSRRHNPQYLRSAIFDVSLLNFSIDPIEVIAGSDIIVVAVPSAFITEAFKDITKDAFKGKKIVSAVKGIIPDKNLLLNEFLQEEYGVALYDYFTLLGPCHAEEVAAEKLSYLTFSGNDPEMTKEIASCFATPYLKTLYNTDVYGAQYAAILKNIYAIGAGMAHGLEYGDNFLSVLIANCADEMAGFLRQLGQKVEVGKPLHEATTHSQKRVVTNYAASVYLGDLLVTCYSLYSRNRTFGNMIGKGYSVSSAQLEMNMVAEGYNASRCIHETNKKVKAEIPIATTVYRILWEGLHPVKGFEYIESILV